MSLLKSLICEWHIGRGLSKFRREKFEAALKHIERALSHCDDIKLHIYRAMLLARLGERELALQTLERCRELHQSDAPTLVLLARAYSELRMKEQALSICEVAIKVDPKNLVASSLLAFILLERGEVIRALELLKTHELADDAQIQSQLLACLENIFVERKPEVQRASYDIEDKLKRLTQAKPIPLLSKLLSWWLSWKGIRLASMQRLHDAITSLTLALSHNPEDMNLRFALCMLLLDAGMCDMAQMLLEGAQEAHPDYHLMRGAIHLYLGELDKARKEIELADESLAITHYLLGMRELQLGDTENAIKEFVKAFELDPAFVRARIYELLKRLTEVQS